MQAKDSVQPEAAYRRPETIRAIRAVALAAAALIAGLLLFTAFAKAAYPNPKEITVEGLGWRIPGPTFERSIAALEVVVAVGLLTLRRAWGAWLLSALFFGALAGYGLFKSWHGEACGCFAKMFDPPPYSMVAVDVVIVGAALSLAAGLRSPRGLLALVMFGVIAAAGAGWAVSDATTPPRREEPPGPDKRLAHALLLDSEAMKDIREQPADGPAWLIFAFDPTCHICEAMKPIIDFKRDELSETGDPVLQVREFSIPEMERDLKIDQWRWETPTLFVVHAGRIVKLWSGKSLEDFTPERFQEIYDTVAAGGYPAEDAPALTAPMKGE